MLTSSQLDAYCARVGHAGPRAPTLATLHALTAAHTQTIPFENLDVLLGRPISLEPEALLAKLVHARRGGYCFEQNGLFLEVLAALGYDVKPISARVRIGRPRDYVPARTHVFLRVELEGESWLTDVGVGGLSLTSAIRLHAKGEQATPHEPRRIAHENGRLYHQARLGEGRLVGVPPTRGEAPSIEWSDICEFTLEEMPLIDREVGNWYTSAHPGSHFKNRLIVARGAPDGVRLTLLNDELSIRARDGSAVKHTLRSPDELVQVLAERFGCGFPEGTRFGAPGSPWYPIA